MKTTAWILALAVVACGGGEEAAEPDAMVVMTPDASTETMEVSINGMTLCPLGYSEKPLAVREDAANRVVVRAGCDEAIEELLIVFSPIPAEGGDAPCTQATFRDGQSELSCRAGNAVIPAPTGTAQSATGRIAGRCECVGEAGMAAAVFSLALQ